ncbi:MAG: hypothetical protein E7561_03725 [Ruminococcaceae bacterium]|nr:hypothetical protein [Oscillospiraceae bacterium]
MKKATLKKLSAIFMSVVMLLTLFSTSIVTMAEGTGEASVNILADEAVVGDIYRVNLATPVESGKTYAEFKDQLVYDNLSVAADSSDYVFRKTDADTKADITATELGLTDDQVIDTKIIAEGNTEGFKLEHNSGGTKCLEGRSALGFDLGGRYDLDNFTLAQNGTKDGGRGVLNLSVYAGDTMDASIFDNKVGSGRANSEEDVIDVTLIGATGVRYVLVVFDHMGLFSTRAASEHTYYATITSLTLGGEKTTNLINNEGTVVDIATITLPEAITHDVDFDETEQAKLNYGENHLLTVGTHKMYLKRQDINDADGDGDTNEMLSATKLGLTNDQVVDSVLAGEANEFIIQAPEAGTANQWRSALAVDLGATYNLETLSFTNSYYGGRKVYNYSVYVGDTLDESIYANKVAVGGSGDENNQTFENLLGDNACGRYVLVVFDLVSTYSKTNVYAYEFFGISDIVLYGEANEILPARQNILTNEAVVGDIYRINLPGSLDYGNGWEVAVDTTRAQTNLVYTNLTAEAHVNGTIAFKKDNMFIGDYGITDDDVIDGQILSDELEGFVINYNAGSSTRVNNRGAIGFDLGANYDLDELVLTKDLALEYRIVQASVYVGDTLDESIFENKVTTARVGYVNDTIKVGFPKGTTAKCVVIVFDHVVHTEACWVNPSTYTDFMVTSMELYGEEVEEVEEVVPENILTNKKVVGDLYRIDLAEALTQTTDHTTPTIFDEAEQAKLVYDNLTKTTGNSDVRFRKIDVEDFDGDGDVTESLYPSQYGITNDDVIDGQLLSDELSGFIINNDSFGNDRNKIRAAIGFELGSKYALDEMIIGQDFTNGRYVSQYSVYVGDTLDASIFENKVTTGYAATNADTTMKVTFPEGTVAKCVLFVFDHVAANQQGTVNMYAYSDFCVSSMALYGETANVLADEAVAGDLYRIELENALTDGVSIDDAAEQAKLNAENYISLNNGDNTKMNFVNGDGTAAGDLGLTDDDVILGQMVSDELEGFNIYYNTAGETRLKNRAAIGFDLGTYYTLDEIVLTKDVALNCRIVQASVYVGDALDASIFENKVGTARVDFADATMKIEFPENTAGKCIVIVFDHVIDRYNGEVIGMYNHTDFSLTNIELYGEVNEELVNRRNTNVLTDERVIGDLFRIDLDEALTQDGVFDENEQAKLMYDNLKRCAINKDVIFRDGNSNSASYNDYTNDDVIDGQILADEITGFTINTDAYGDGRNQIRAAIGFELGANYTLDDLVITQDLTGDRRISQASVYVGDALDASIFANKAYTVTVAEDEDTIRFEFDENTTASCVLFVFDHVYSKNSGNIINKYAYSGFCVENIELHGSEIIEIETVYGDINSDTNVNVLDYIALSKVIDGQMTVDTAVADLNGDGAVDLNDLIVLKKMLLGVEVTQLVTYEVNLDPDGVDGVDAF